MKIFLFGLALLVVCFSVLGCRIYSWMILENPEFPKTLVPSEFTGDLLDKYSVSGVIVEPRFWHVDGNQTNYQLVVMFHSEETNLNVRVESASVMLDDESLSDGAVLINQQPTPWKLYESNDPFYTSRVKGAPIERPKAELVKSVQVDVSLTVAVTDEDGSVTRKQIDCHFLPKKRSYLE